MKRMMSSQSALNLPIKLPKAVKRETSVKSNGSSGNRLHVLQDAGRSGMESEEDWTGTGDDWTGTGASSDSGFINFIRTRQGHPINSRSHCASPPPPIPPKGHPHCASPPPPIPPKGHPHCESPPPPIPPKGHFLLIPQDSECHYMKLTSSTMDQDNKYATINSKELLAKHAAEFRQEGRFSDYQQPRLVTTGDGHMTLSVSNDLINSFTDKEAVSPHKK